MWAFGFQKLTSDPSSCITFFEIVVNLHGIWLTMKATHIHYKSFSCPSRFSYKGILFQNLSLIYIFKLCVLKYILHTKEQTQWTQGILPLSLQNDGLGADLISKCVLCNSHGAASSLIHKNLYFHFFWKIRRSGVTRCTVCVTVCWSRPVAVHFRCGSVSSPSLAWSL